MDNLQYLLTLESLVFENMIISKRGSEPGRVLSEKCSNVISASNRLKSLSFSFETFGTIRIMHHTNSMMERCNLLLYFTLISCPFLKEIRLKGHIDAYSVLDLDFTRHN